MDLLKYLFEHLDKVVIVITFINITVKKVKEQIKKRKRSNRSRK